MRHNQLTDELQERASLYAAGALPEGERLEYARHIADDQCGVCGSETAELQNVMALVAFSIPAAVPPDSLKVRLMDQARNAKPLRPKSAIFFGRWWFELLASAVAVAALVVLASVQFANRELLRLNQLLYSRIAQLELQVSKDDTYLATLTSPDVRVVNLAGQGVHAKASGRIFWDQSRKRWLFYVYDLPRVASNQSYQLWFVPKAGNPISAVVFNTEADGTAQVEIEVPDTASGLKAAAVTTEPAGGLPQPSGPFALLGALE